MARGLWLRWAEEKPDPDDLVFTAERGARIQPPNLMARVLKPAAVQAGVGEWVEGPRGRRAETWVGFHTFRHTCATILFRHGWNAVQVQRWLGHHKPSFTLDTYVSYLETDLADPDFMDAIGAADGQQVGNTSTVDGGRRGSPDEDTNPAISRESLRDTPAVSAAVATS
jgi:integrase